LAGKHQISHAALVAGDADLIPAVEAADLWDVVDERVGFTQDFMNSIAR
jgi:uncharacterized LabA/DUF88 family protein